jgi:hypothetical protein
MISNIKSQDTRNMFKEFISTYSKIIVSDNRVNIFLMNLAGIAAKKHNAIAVDPIVFKKVLDTKYFGILDVVDSYGAKTSSVYKIINFIDEKS